MISRDSYSKEAIDSLYSAVETAMENDHILDLESIAALNNGLTAFKYNVIFSCHDHQLTQTVANRIIEVTEDGIIDRLCTYDEYMNLIRKED